GSEIHTQDKGTPQGSPLSPLLANIYLDQLDKQWKSSGLQNRYTEDAHLIRYADDYLVLMTGNPAVAKKKLDEIMEDIDL
ncbi:RNA-directed DNA polymerase (reverse transcriptase) domain protein, partial [mine drainage metagenome]